MHIKEIYRIWEETDFKDNDMKKSFERAINTRAVIDLIIESRRLKDKLEETGKTLREVIDLIIEHNDTKEKCAPRKKSARHKRKARVKEF